MSLTYRNDRTLVHGKVEGSPEDVKRLIEASASCEVTTTPIRATFP